MCKIENRYQKIFGFAPIGEPGQKNENFRTFIEKRGLGESFMNTIFLAIVTLGGQELCLSQLGGVEILKKDFIIPIYLVKKKRCFGFNLRAF